MSAPEGTATERPLICIHQLYKERKGISFRIRRIEAFPFSFIALVQCRRSDIYKALIYRTWPINMERYWPAVVTYNRLDKCWTRAQKSRFAMYGPSKAGGNHILSILLGAINGLDPTDDMTMTDVKRATWPLPVFSHYYYHREEGFVGLLGDCFYILQSCPSSGSSRED